jgi:hypothetical protein
VTPKHAKASRPVSEAKIQLLVMVGLARIGITLAPVAMLGVLVS